MVEKDIEQLRIFGQKVQTRKNSSVDPNSKRSFRGVFSQLQVFIVDVIGSCYGVIKKRFSILCNLPKYSLTWRMVNWKKRDNRFNYEGNWKHETGVATNSSVLVEYQKQWGNLSIIIRRRKKNQTKQLLVESIQSPPSAAVAYYFHRIDAKNDAQKNLFYPKRCMWDFRYRSSGFFISKLKNFFHF
jgi:hypothetical protein